MQSKEKINNNEFKYVDLELPSGTLWATCNVGADKPSDYGMYFQWGDTSGYEAYKVGTGDGKKKFAPDSSDYKWYSGSTFTKYTTPGATLDLEDDAAHVHMGGDWHMPRPTQIQELLDNTTNTWVTMNDENGRLFISNKDDSKYIFIPAAGLAFDGFVRNSDQLGCIWSSMISSLGNLYGQYLYFDMWGAKLYYGHERWLGMSVRGVIG